jgi:hypothetical protein
MKYFGNIDLQNNFIQQAVMETETQFPAEPVVGRLIFLNKIVYICAAIVGGLPIWIPLTNEIDMYVHIQQTGTTTWTIIHPLNSTDLVVQIWDTENKAVIPDEINVINNTQVQVKLGMQMAGKAVLMAGAISGNVRPTIAFTWNQTVAASSWVINHGLGYDPIVRVFVGNVEVQPQVITHNSVNQLTIGFTDPQVGVAKLI